MNKNIFKVLSIFIIITLLSGCNQKFSESNINSQIAETEINEENSQIESETEKDTVPISGGTLNMSMRVPKTLNPLINEDYTVDNVLKLIFEPLFNLDDEQKLVPNLADAYLLSPDGLSMTITLKSGITWEDGRSITAKDVIFSLDTIRSAPEFSMYKDTLEYVTGYRASGNSSVVIQYSQTNSQCLYNLCFPIIPEHYYKNALDIENEKNFKPLGNGLYKVQDYQLVRKITLEKSSNFKGTPYIDNVNVIITPNEQTDLDAFEQNVTDVISVDIGQWGKFSSGKNMKATSYNTNNFEFLGFNFQNPNFSNVKIRQAIVYALPYDEIINNIYIGNAYKSVTPINPLAWISSKTINEKYEFDLEKARNIIKETGFTKEQLSYSILVNEENNERVESAEIIKNSLNQIGMNIAVKKVPYSQYLELLSTDKFDLFIGGARLKIHPDLRSLFLSSSQVSPGINYFNYSDSTMDNLINNSLNAKDEESFKNSIAEIENYFGEQLPCIGICFKSSILLTDKRIGGEKLPTLNNIFNNIKQWYIVE